MWIHIFASFIDIRCNSVRYESSKIVDRFISYLKYYELSYMVLPFKKKRRSMVYLLP